jgi:predicted Zn-dependent protease
VQQYIPGTETPENKKYATAAMDEFPTVLKADPNNLLATESMASLYYNMKDFPKAEEWNKKVVALDPKEQRSFLHAGRDSVDAIYRTGPRSPPQRKDAARRSAVR